MTTATDGVPVAPGDADSRGIAHLRRELREGCAVGMIYVRELLVAHDLLKDHLRAVEAELTERRAGRHGGPSEERDEGYREHVRTCTDPKHHHPPYSVHLQRIREHRDRPDVDTG